MLGGGQVGPLGRKAERTCYLWVVLQKCSKMFVLDQKLLINI